MRRRQVSSLLLSCGVAGAVAALALSVPRQDLVAATAAPAMPAVVWQASEAVAARYAKREHAIPMRDGVRLHTAVYTPRSCVEGGAPILLTRTPYGVGPYGPEAFPRELGPSARFVEAGFIVAYQDVRGRYLSEGLWEEVRPHVPAAQLARGEATESTDAYDTIDWLLRHVSCHNGRVGMWGISYPGFYASAGMIEAHPALRAVSPQGPVTDYFLDDDSFHNGAFLLAHNFSFYVNFFPRGPEPRRPALESGFDFGTSDHYAFYLGLGSLTEGSRRFGLLANPYWMMNLEHTTYDAFWKARGIWRHFREIAPAVLTVGGWYDAENMHGALRTHAALREQSPATISHLVMGPWTHGGWARGRGDRVGALALGEPTAQYYRERIEYPFLARHLLGADAAPPLPLVSVFDTGRHIWHELEAWPAPGTREVAFFLAGGRRLATEPPAASGHYSYVSDPATPVPVVERPAAGMPDDYMARDQRFATSRDDVLVYVSEPLYDDLTVLGPVTVDFQVATSGTDSDFVVKLVDVHPGGADALQQLVRGEPFRGKFRESLERPVPFVPGRATRLTFALGDAAHTFRRGHRVMVHVQGSWFPLVDRNPQTFTHIPDAAPEQFVKATHTVFHGGATPSRISLRAR